jgi:hypothetical protein
MYKDRLFENENEYYGFTTMMGSPKRGLGNTYYVVNAADTAVVADFKKRLDGIVYADGSSPLFVATSLAADGAIQAALNACVANRDDTVVIMPSDTNYSITATLQATKKGVHIICPTGIGYDFPIGNTARLKSIVAATAVINFTAQAIEFAGFYVKNYADVAAITLAATALSPNIHHNSFMLVWTASPAAAIVGSGAAGAWGGITRNWFISETGTGVTAAIAAIDIAAQATGCRVCGNELTIGDGNTATVGISNLAVKGHTDFNVFSSSGGIAVTPSGGAITNCVSINTMACAIGNRGAVAASALLTGGTAAHSYCDNMDGATGTGNGSQSNLET